MQLFGTKLTNVFTSSYYVKARNFHERTLLVFFKMLQVAAEVEVESKSESKLKSKFVQQKEN